MPPLKSTACRLHASGLLSQHPSHAIETLSQDAPYLSDGRASLVVVRLDHKNLGGYRCYETAIHLVVDGQVEREFSIANRPCPTSWETPKGCELRMFIHRCYDRLHDLAREAETQDEEELSELLLSARRNAARLIEEKRKFG